MYRSTEQHCDTHDHVTWNNVTQDTWLWEQSVMLREDGLYDVGFRDRLSFLFFAGRSGLEDT